MAKQPQSFGSFTANVGFFALPLGIALSGCSSQGDNAGAVDAAGRSGSALGGTAAAGRSATAGSRATSGGNGGSVSTAANGGGSAGRQSTVNGGTTAGGNDSAAGGGSGGAAAAGAGKATGGVVSSAGGKAATGGTNGGAGKAAAGGSNGVGGKAAVGGSNGVGGKAAAGGTSTGGNATTGGVTGAGGAAGAVSIGTPNVTIDRTKTLQTIDGFGFFGARDVWWGSAADLWADDWGTMVLNDLGMTIWRSEYYSEQDVQDANWAKQRPVAQGFKRLADANRIPLKTILTVWTPPSSMKCTVESVQAGQKPCTAHPDGTKNGGTLDPSKYNAYAQWLAQGVQNYADIGIDVYAVSAQNEPMFVEPYNSCVYDVEPAELNSYARMVAAVGPALKQLQPNVKVFGTENMLALEGQQWFYSAKMPDSGWAALDILAYHGYQDGVAPTAGSQLATYWTNVRENYATPLSKPSWMTETSGYVDSWADANGAKSLGFAIYAALSYGQASAWIWWQGSSLGGPPDQYSLMGGTQYPGKRYYASKQFYRYIRPGAKMLTLTSSDPDLFVAAFSHATMGAFTVVAINNSAQDKKLILGGANVPSTFDAHRTSATENCVSLGSVVNGSIVLKADSITTLVNGNVIE